MGDRTRLAPVSCTIRAATLADVEALVAMVNASYARSEGHVFARTDRTNRGNFSRDIDGVTVAEHEGAIVGCVQIDVAHEPAHFGLLATDLALQGRGIATQLIAYAERRAVEGGRHVMRIETVKEAGPKALYEALGYRAIKETPGQVWNGGADWGAVIDWHMIDMEKVLP